MRRKNLIYFFNVFNLVALFLMTGLIYFYADKLPESIPTHFGLDGNPDAWGGKGNLVIFLFVGFGLNALLYAIVFSLPWLRKNPFLINAPGKEKILALPEEKQVVYWALIKEFMLAILISLNIIWLLMLWFTIRVGMGQTEKLPSSLIFIIILLVFAIIIFYSRQLKKTANILTEQNH